MYVASEKLGTAVMKEEECLLFVETAMENGSDIAEAAMDMKMIDTLLYAERLHKSVGQLIKKTRAGHYRKGSDFYTTIEGIIEARADGLL